MEEIKIRQEKNQKFDQYKVSFWIEHYGEDFQKDLKFFKKILYSNLKNETNNFFIDYYHRDSVAAKMYFEATCMGENLKITPNSIQSAIDKSNFTLSLHEKQRKKMAAQ